MPFNKTSNLLFIHIPKNGGKTIEDAFYMSTKPGKAANQDKRSFISKAAKKTLSLLNVDNHICLRGDLDCSVVGQHLTFSEIYFLNLVENLHEKQIFATVRNPFERILSLYCHHTPSRKWSVDNLEFFTSTWPQYKPYGIRHNLLAHKRTQTDFIDNHFFSQCNIDIYKLEELDLKSLSHKYSIIPRMKNEYFKSKFHDSVGNRSKMEKEMKDKLYLTQKAVDNVVDYYYHDFINFNYSKSYTKK